MDDYYHHLLDRVHNPTPAEPTSPLCIHNNNADRCVECGTAKPRVNIQVGALAPGGHSGSATTFQQRWRCRHGLEECAECDFEASVAADLEVKRFQEVKAINALSETIWREQREAAEHARWAGKTCGHGYPLWEHYHGICSTVAAIENEPGYDINKYRRAINLALRTARRIFGAPPPPKETPVTLQPEVKVKDEVVIEKEVDYVSSRYKTEREKHFEDVRQRVDLEIWRACKRYGDKMNDALAYQTAKRTAGKFLGDLIDDTTVLTGIAWEFMPPEFRELAEMNFRFCSQDLETLLALSKDDRADPERREIAKRTIKEYGERAPRYTYDQSEDSGANSDEEDDKGDTSAVDSAAVRRSDARGSRPVLVGGAPDRAETFEAYRPELEALVKTWFGEKRRVAEAMLAGTFTVRGVAGMPKSQAQRLYVVVTKAFRDFFKKVGTT
jgi:hypothetical protein